MQGNNIIYVIKLFQVIDSYTRNQSPYTIQTWCFN